MNKNKLFTADSLAGLDLHSLELLYNIARDDMIASFDADVNSPLACTRRCARYRRVGQEIASRMHVMVESPFYAGGDTTRLRFIAMSVAEYKRLRLQSSGRYPKDKMVTTFDRIVS